MDDRSGSSPSSVLQLLASCGRCHISDTLQRRTRSFYVKGILANDLNNHGQIVGGSSLTGDSTIHAFAWNASTGVTDLLDPSDSSYGFAEGKNDHGDVAGGVCDSVTCYAVLWLKIGGQWQRNNLSAVTDNAFSISINSSEQVVGNVTVDVYGAAAFVSEHGGPIVDLNTLISPGSGIHLYEAVQINDRGEIAAQGPDANGNNHADC